MKPGMGKILKKLYLNTKYSNKCIKIQNVFKYKILLKKYSNTKYSQYVFK